jgi:hypothetical protein
LPSLQESEIFDAKADVPGPGKAVDFAVDVAAMANDGGSIVYGIAEDKVTGTFHPHPIALAGQSERLSDVIHQLILDPPVFRVLDVPLPEDPSLGFLVLAVPASPLAPHMVKKAFWGRAGTINVKLSQGEVDRLYARRRIWERDAEEALQAAIGENRGVGNGIYLVARPLLAGSDLLTRSGLEDRERLGRVLIDNDNRTQFKTAPALSSALSILMNGQMLPTLGGVALEFNGPGDHDHHRLELLSDGTVRFYWSGAAQRRQGGLTTIFDSTCAQLAVRVLAFAGRLLQLVGYDGPATAAVCIRGAQGAVSDAWLSPESQGGNLGVLPPGDYQKALRVDSAELVHDASRVAGLLMRPILRVLRPSGAADPLEI